MSTALHALLWLGNVVPRAEGPLPDSIGLSFPFTAAGAGGVIGGLVRPGATAPQRDRLVSVLSAWFFWGGTVVYGVVFAYQLLSKQ